jgi:AcrR family transcriptional regulator
VSPATGRREANKLATRGALRQAASRLFAEQGYEATTVAQIARAAQVGERTFYRYFDGKAALLAEQALAWIDALHDAIRDRPAEEDPYLAVARAMIAVAGQYAAAADPGGIWIFTETSQLLALLRRATPRPLRRLEESIAAAILHRLEAAPGGTTQPPGKTSAEFQAQLLARVAVAALRTAAIYHREQVRGGASSLGIERLLQDAFAQLADLTRRLPPHETPAGSDA